MYPASLRPGREPGTVSDLAGLLDVVPVNYPEVGKVLLRGMALL
jgi:hypothetical protein